MQSSSGRDQFDSDFGQTESDHGEEDEEENKKMDVEVDDDKAKEKKRRAELMKKVNTAKIPEKKDSVVKKQPRKEEKE